MNSKVLLFISMLMIILSAGAVSSADVDHACVTDSSVIADESLDIDDFSDVCSDDELILDESNKDIKDVSDDSSDSSLKADFNETETVNIENNSMKKIPTKILSTDVDAFLKEDEYLTITLKDSDSIRLIGYTLSVDLNGVTDYTTDKRGRIRIPTKGLGVGKHIANIRFAGDDIYEESYKTANVNIKPGEICEAQDLNGLNSAISAMKTKKVEETNNTLLLNNDIKSISKKLIITINQGKYLTIDGRGHTIDLAGSSKHDLYFVVKSGDVIFKNINFINGYNKDGDKGGAISFEDDAIGTIINCTFKNCWAEKHGGAIADRTGNRLTLINSTFIGYKASDDNGGAIFCEGALLAEGCLFELNSAKVDDGAIFCKGDMRVVGSVFKSNKASGARSQCYGGAVRTEGIAYIVNSTFENNTSDDYSGAVYAKIIKINQNQNNAQGYNTFFIGNTAKDNNGGAVFCECEAYVKNAKFFGNKAYEDGEAIHGRSVTADHCLFDSNKAMGAVFSKCEGGAICSKMAAYLYNSDFLNNVAERGGAVAAQSVIMSKLHFYENKGTKGKDDIEYV